MIDCPFCTQGPSQEERDKVSAFWTEGVLRYHRHCKLEWRLFAELALHLHLSHKFIGENSPTGYYRCPECGFNCSSYVDFARHLKELFDEGLLISHLIQGMTAMVLA